MKTNNISLLSNFDLHCIYFILITFSFVTLTVRLCLIKRINKTWIRNWIRNFNSQIRLVRMCWLIFYNSVDLKKIHMQFKRLSGFLIAFSLWSTTALAFRNRSYGICTPNPTSLSLFTCLRIVFQSWSQDQHDSFQIKQSVLLYPA